MTVHGLVWEGCKGGVTEEMLAAVEKRLGVMFPVEYRQLVTQCQSGAPERSHFYYDDPRHGRSGGGLGVMLMIDPAYDDSILRTLEMLAHDDQMPEGVIPFAEDGGGDMMCFDFRTRPDAPSVVYWAHERNKEESVFPLADSFMDFLAMLGPDPDYDLTSAP